MITVFLLLWQFLYRVSDSAMDSPFCFFCKVFKSFKTAGDLLPDITSSYKSAINLIAIKRSFTEYVVCPKCHSLYLYEDCVENRANHQRISKYCKFVGFPNHRCRQLRSACGELLLKQSRVMGSDVKLVARKTYPYISLKDSLASLISMDGFIEQCEQWRQRAQDIPPGILADVYDGRVWKQFCREHNQFLQLPGNFLLLVNMDFFQPFSHTTYSVGVIYCVVLNLPRELRYKTENMIVISVIPGPHEPKLNINTYLKPPVDELQEVYKGVVLPCSSGYLKQRHVRACVVCLAADIPASRKMCGFLGHSARLACNKCYKSFLSDHATFDEKPNYGGFDRQTWEPRTMSRHQESCLEIKTATNKSQLQQLESMHGVRYSVLMEMPYFDPIKFVVIDPMHNLMLGSSKHVLSVWLSEGIFNDSKLKIIEDIVKQIQSPHDIGRLPTKIGSGFSGFSADQWRIWTTIYSAIALKGIIPEEHLRCWLLFVRACTILFSRIVSETEVRSADQFLVTFCKKFEELYGQKHCTPNMHLHLHLLDCLLDYGPAQGFWCFPFERFNGRLGDYHTNNKTIECQIMNKLCHEQAISRLDLAKELGKDFHCLYQKISSKTKGSLKQTVKVEYLRLLRSLANFSEARFNIENSCVKEVPPVYKHVLSLEEQEYLKIIYEELYPHRVIKFFPMIYEKCKRAVVGEELVSSVRYKDDHQSVIVAYWPSTGHSLATIDYTNYRVGVIQYFLKHAVTFVDADGTEKKEEHIFCYVVWKQQHHNENWFGVSAVVTSTLGETEDACCYMPIQRVMYRCASGTISVNFGLSLESVFVAIPVNTKFCY